MKLAVLGAPGAGKTSFANGLARKLNHDKKEWVVVDKYVDKLQKRTGLTFGEETNFVQEIEVLGARWAAEDEAFNQGYHTITCGSIYETILYASNQRQLYSPTEQELVREQVYVQTMMHALGSMESMTFDYHGLLYLPWEKGHAKSWHSVVNAKIPEVLAGFGRGAVTLVGTNKQKVDRAIQYLSPLFHLPRMTNQQFDEVEQVARDKNIKLNLCPTCGSKRIEVEPDSGVYVWPDSTYRLDGMEHPCDCASQIELARHYLLANIPTDYWTLSEDEYFGDPEALAKVQAYLERWPDMFHHGIGMEFYSPTMGTGKTMLATMIAKHLVKAGERVYFTPFRQTVGVFEMPYEARQATERLLRHVPVLVLDEVVRSHSDAQRAFYAEKLEDLIRYRTSGNAVTIITTNLTPKELDEQYPRAFSLLSASAQQVFVSGEDARRAGDVAMLKLELVMNNEARPIR